MNSLYLEVLELQCGQSLGCRLKAGSITDLRLLVQAVSYLLVLVENDAYTFDNPILLVGYSGSVYTAGTL